MKNAPAAAILVLGLFLLLCSFASAEERTEVELKVKAFNKDQLLNVETILKGLKPIYIRGFESEQFHDLGMQGPENGYECASPFRGVLTYGESKIGFVLDSTDLEVCGYDRLFIDINLDRVLDDDEVFLVDEDKALEDGARIRHVFRNLEVQLPAHKDGDKPSFTFLCDDASGELISWMLAPEFYYEAEIAAGDDIIKAAVLDSNGNGKWDPYTYNSSRKYDDMILFTPTWDEAQHKFQYEWRSGGERLLELSGIWFKIDPDEYFSMLGVVTLDTGFLKNPNLEEDMEFHVSLYEMGTYADAKGKGPKKVKLPVGNWYLSSYTITRDEPGKDRDKNESKSLLRAEWSEGCEPFEIKKDTTTEYPFGLPLKASVQASPGTDGAVYFNLALTGKEGCACKNLYVKGERPPRPAITIANKKGKVIERGSMEYG